MRTVVLIGTDHRYQRASDADDGDETQFRNTILEILDRQAIKSIAEEMSKEALAHHGAKNSIVELVCTERGIPHQFSDPTNSERLRLEIRQDSDIRAEHLSDGSTQEQIEADVEARGANASDRVREKYCWHRIQELQKWPILFICGANHVDPLVELLTKDGAHAVIAHRDWEPT